MMPEGWGLRASSPPPATRFPERPRSLGGGLLGQGPDDPIAVTVGRVGDVRLAGPVDHVLVPVGTDAEGLDRLAGMGPIHHMWYSTSSRASKATVTR